MMEISVKELLLDYASKRAEKTHRRPTIGIYYPSGLVSSCLKAQYNAVALKPSKGVVADGDLLRMLEGTLFHEVVQKFKAFDTIEASCVKQFNSPAGKFSIRGRADAVAGDVVFEFKRTAFIPRKPKFDHILQLNFYLHCLGKARGELVYMGKNGDEFDIVQYPVLQSDWHFQHLVNRAIVLHSLLRNKQIPQCSCRSRKHDLDYINRGKR